MTTGHKIFLQLNSGDFTATAGNAQAFRNTLATPLVLNKDKAYEVSVWDAFFPVRQDVLSVYVNVNIVTGSIIGSQLTSTVLFVPFSEVAPALNQNLYYTTALARKWYPLSMKSIPYIDVSFTLSTGAAMPIDNGDFSTITLAIREVMY